MFLNVSKSLIFVETYKYSIFLNKIKQEVKINEQRNNNPRVLQIHIKAASNQQ